MIRLGVIGLSEGNGHPYSWSAIFNGYDKSAMEDCGFPVIPRYLENQRFPQDAIPGAKVTHVWTQETKLSEKVATAALIPNVADKYIDLVGHVDAILLARDDAETHFEIAKPFLEAGLPIYIDKPMALTTKDANRMFDHQEYDGQIFSCSALRYAKEFKLSPFDSAKVGKVIRIKASSPKDWNKYSIHAIDPVLRMLGDRGEFSKASVTKSGDTTMLNTKHESGIEIQIATLGAQPVPIQIILYGTDGSITLQFKNTYDAFKAALQDFVDGIKTNTIRTHEDQILRAVSLIEAGYRA